MQNLLKLCKREEGFRDFYLNSGADIYDHPISLEEYRRVIEESHVRYRDLLIQDFSEILYEDNFFQESQDISVFQHYRYLPAIDHEHDFFEVAFVLSGQCTNYVCGQRMLLNPGDIFIIAPGTIHSVSTFQDECVMINILIRSSTFESHFMNLLPKNDLLYHFFLKTLYHSSELPYLIFKTGDDQALKDSVVQLYQEYYHNSRYKSTMVNSLLSTFFVNLMRRHEQDVIIPGMQSSVMNEETIFILQYMQQNYRTITLSHLAEFFNYSERQIQRIITAATGKNFSDNIRQLRMSHASEMLRDSKLTVSEIAEALGYYDTSNFRKVFKAYYHMTPQEYRKSQLIPAT